MITAEFIPMVSISQFLSLVSLSLSRVFKNNVNVKTTLGQHSGASSTSVGGQESLSGGQLASGRSGDFVIDSSGLDLKL